MSAIPTPAATAPASFAPSERRPLPVAATLVWVGRTTLLLAAAMLVPGEAERIGSSISARPRG